jgi:hypothetical protein
MSPSRITPSPSLLFSLISASCRSIHWCRMSSFLLPVIRGVDSLVWASLHPCLSYPLRHSPSLFSDFLLLSHYDPNSSVVSVSLSGGLVSLSLCCLSIHLSLLVLVRVLDGPASKLVHLRVLPALADHGHVSSSKSTGDPLAPVDSKVGC